MPTSESARHALYTRLEEVLGTEHATTLMTQLPHETDAWASKADILRLESRMDHFEERFDRLEDRFDRMEERFDRLEDVVRDQQKFYVATTVGSMTALTAIFSIVVGMLA